MAARAKSDDPDWQAYVVSLDRLRRECERQGESFARRMKTLVDEDLKRLEQERTARPFARVTQGATDG
jgi:predicted secreted protein